jgi:anti-anti-sigma factor
MTGTSPMVLNVIDAPETVSAPLTLRVLRPVGLLDGNQAGGLRREVEALMQDDLDVVLVDLVDTSFIDSSGLGALVSALKIVRAAGRRMALCSPNAQIKMVFELSGMDQAFALYETRSDFDASLVAAV